MTVRKYVRDLRRSHSDCQPVCRTLTGLPQLATDGRVVSRPSLNIGAYGFRGIPSTYSGYETFLTVLLPALAERGHEVTAYCRSGKVDDNPTHRGVRKTSLPSLDTKELGTLTHGFLCALASRYRRHDVLLVVNPANSLYCGLAKFTGQPVALNTDGQEWLRGKWGRLGRAVFKLSARSAGFLSTALISDSVAMATIYQNQFRAASTVIPYCWTAIDERDGTAILSRLALAPRGYLCIAGRLIPENNAVAVARAYVESQIQLPLVIVGTANYDSPVQRSLDELAAQNERIVLAGHINDRSEYAELVRSAAVYIHAHSVGGINPSLVEAMGVGAAIVSLSTPFNKEALGVEGRYFEDFGPEVVRVIADRLSASPDDDLMLRAAARSRAHSEFSVDAVVDAIELLLTELAHRRSWRRFSMPTRWSATSAEGGQ